MIKNHMLQRSEVDGAMFNMSFYIYFLDFESYGWIYMAIQKIKKK
jgi:hypothetical protein